MPNRYIVADSCSWPSDLTKTFAVDSASYNNSQAASTALTILFVASSTFTPGAITVDGIMVQVASRASGSPSNTISVCIGLAGVAVTGTTVTANVSDIDTCDTGNANGGWYFFKFSSPVLLVGATVYSVMAKLSATTTAVSLYSSATTNWSRMLRTTTAAGSMVDTDELHFASYFDGGASGARVSATVTANNTAATNFGSSNTSVTTPGLSVNKGCIVTWATTASQTFLLKHACNMCVYSGGSYREGTVSAPIDATSTLTHTYNCASNVDFGLTILNGGDWQAKHATTKTGKTVLTADVASGSSKSCTVATASNWVNGDTVVFAPTGTTVAASDATTISSLSGTTFTAATLANAHSGTSPTQAEVLNLTRGIVHKGVSASICGYIDIKAVATVDYRNVEFTFLGSGTSLKVGINVATTTGTHYCDGCSAHDFNSTSSVAINVTSASGSNITVSNLAGYNFPSVWCQNVGTTGVQTWDNIHFIKGWSHSFADAGSSYTNFTVSGASNGSMLITETAPIGTIQNITIHSSAQGLQPSGLSGGTISNLKVYRSSNPIPGSMSNVLIDGFESFGNGAGFQPVLGNGTWFYNCRIKDMTSNGDTTSATANGIGIGGGAVDVIFENAIFSQVSGIKTAHTTDINCSIFGGVGSGLRLVFINPTFGAATLLSARSVLAWPNHIKMLNVNGTAGDNRYYDATADQKRDTVIYSSSPQSWRITPLTTATKSRSGCINGGAGFLGSYVVAVASGGTATVSVKVRESVVGDGTAYNGARARLIVLRNYAAGITSDTVIATATVASNGAWETISGTTASVAQNALLEFVVDCDGTTGWLNMDDWAG